MKKRLYFCNSVPKIKQTYLISENCQAYHALVINSGMINFDVEIKLGVFNTRAHNSKSNEHYLRSLERVIWGVEVKREWELAALVEFAVVLRHDNQEYLVNGVLSKHCSTQI